MNAQPAEKSSTPRSIIHEMNEFEQSLCEGQVVSSKTPINAARSPTSPPSISSLIRQNHHLKISVNLLRQTLSSRDEELAILKEQRHAEDDMMRYYGQMEFERRKLMEEMKVVEAECDGLREENAQLKNVKLTLERRL